MMELDHDARRLLELTRQSRTPTATDKARVERLLGGALLLGGASAHAASGGAASKMFGTALATKWAGIALLAVASGAGYFGWHAWRASHDAARPSSAMVAAVVPVETALAGARVPAAPAPAAEEVADTPSRAVAPPATPTRSTGVHGTLPEELDLLHEAQAKWRAGNASSALGLLSEHRQRFPRSQLGPERDALTVLSLCATSRTAEAKKLARRFLQTAKHSPLRASVEESCGGK
jgi:hypothetical protein